MAWYGMLMIGLQVRNPILPQSRIRYWDVLFSTSRQSPIPPSAPTSGIAVQVVRGPTGTGKSVTAKRFCAMLGRQRIDHRPNTEAGWKQLSQLVYLYTDLSPDGSRGGFLTGILIEMDAALGTNYAIDLPKRVRTIDRLTIATVGRLVAHYTGIIFIDEGQLRNLMWSDQADLMQLFLLTLMNSGIPIVLMGNECAFDWIDYSQDISRLNTVSPEHFHPVGALDSADIATDRACLYQGIESYYVLPRPPADSASCRTALQACCGGIGRLGLILWTNGQKNALVAGRDHLTADDIFGAYQSKDFDDLRPLADGFSKRLPELLLSFPDVDAHYYARCWGVPIGPPLEAETPAQQGRKARPAQQRRKRRSETAKFKAEQTRKQNEQIAREHMAASLSLDDLRRSEAQKRAHLEALDAVQRRIEASKRNAKDNQDAA